MLKRQKTAQHSPPLYWSWCYHGPAINPGIYAQELLCFESALDVTSPHFQSLLLLTALETIGAAGGGEILFLLIIFLFQLFLKHY